MHVSHMAISLFLIGFFVSNCNAAQKDNLYLFEAISHNVNGIRTMPVAYINSNYIESHIGKSGVATIVHALPRLGKVVKNGENELKFVATESVYAAGNYATRQIYMAASEHMGGLEGLATKCDVLPDTVLGCKVRDNVNPRVRLCVESLAPCVEECVCEVGGTLATVTAVAIVTVAINSIGSWLVNS